MSDPQFVYATAGGLDGEIPYWELPRDTRQETIDHIFMQLGAGPGMVLCDANFVMNVQPWLIGNLVDKVIEWGIVPKVGLLLITVNLLMNWLVGQLLGRIWLPLTYAYHAYCYMSCVLLDAGCYGVGSLMLLCREAFFGYRNTKDEVVPIVRYMPAPRSSGWKIDWVLMMGAAIGVLAWFAEMSGKPAQPLYVTAMIMLFWSFTVNAPNAGGNSIWANVPYFMMFMLVLLLLEPFRKFITTALDERGAVMETVERQRQEFNSGYSLWVLVRNLDLTARYFNTVGGAGFVKAVLGSMVTTLVIVDSVVGPGHMLKGIAKVERLTITKFSAGLYSNSLIVWVVLEVLLHAMSGGWEKISSITMGTVIGTFLWGVILPSIWETKGVAATATRLRTNLIIHFGDSAKGIRKLALRLAILACFLVDTIQEGVGLTTLTLVAMAMRSDRIATLTLGHLSGNLVMLVYEFFVGDFLTGDLSEGPSVQRGDMGNVGGGEALDAGGNAGSDGIDWKPVPPAGLLECIDACYLRSDQVVLPGTLDALRRWAGRSGGIYRVVSLAEATDDEVAFVLDDGRRVLERRTSPCENRDDSEGKRIIQMTDGERALIMQAEATDNADITGYLLALEKKMANDLEYLKKKIEGARRADSIYSSRKRRRGKLIGGKTPVAEPDDNDRV